MSWEPLDREKPDAGYLGDDPFDEIADCFAAVCGFYERDWQRRPTLDELIGTVEAVLRVQLQDHTSDGDTAELVSVRARTRKRPKRQRFAEGDILMALLVSGEPVYGRVFAVESLLGPLVGVYDSRGMNRRQLDGIVKCRLAVNIRPIHRECLQDRGWLVIGNRKLTAADEDLPRRVDSLTGGNPHLDAANHYYGFTDTPFRNVHEWHASR